MCGRYTITREEMKLVTRFAEKFVRLCFVPRYNIAPTQKSPVVIVENGRIEQREMKWGFQPSWAKNPIINAQSETLNEKPTFKTAFQSRRCLVPADSFYEWKTIGQVKQPIRIMPANGEPFFMAGLWYREIKPVSSEPTFFDNEPDEIPKNQIEETFLILTGGANDFMRPIHHRMPFIVSPNHYDWWLDDSPANELYKSVIQFPSTEKLVGHPVRLRVNNARHDDPACITPSAVNVLD